MKHKVGDKVRILNNEKTNNCYTIGEVVTITEVDDKDYSCVGNKIEQWIGEEECELYEEDKQEQEPPNNAEMINALCRVIEVFGNIESEKRLEICEKAQKKLNDLL